MAKKKRTKFRLKDMKTGLVRTVESHSQAYEIGKVYEGTSMIDGSKYHEECVEVIVPSVGFNSIPAPGLYPMWSDALGVNPDQIPEAMAADREAGFNTEYHPDTGAIRFPDKATRKRYCEAHGYHDMNAGYGDPQKR